MTAPEIAAERTAQRIVAAMRDIAKLLRTHPVTEEIKR